MSEVCGPKLGLKNIGEEAQPPCAIPPAPASLLLSRSNWRTALAPGHELGAIRRLRRAMAIATLRSMAAEGHERMTSA